MPWYVSLHLQALPRLLIALLPCGLAIAHALQVREVQKGALGSDLRAAAVAAAHAWALAYRDEELDTHMSPIAANPARPPASDVEESPARLTSVQTQLAGIGQALATARKALLVGYTPSGDAAAVRTAEDELPYYAKWLVLAAWLAKSVSPEMDAKLLTPGRAGTKRRRSTTTGRATSKSQSGKSFSLERLLAVYYALVAGAHGLELAKDALTADGVACVRLLERIGVLHRGAHGTQGGKWTAAIGWATAERVAQKLDMHQELARWAQAAGITT